VKGWSLRLLSLFIWVFLISTGSLAVPALLLGVGDAGKHLSSAITEILVTFACIVAPVCLEWFMCQQTFEWGSLDWLVHKKWIRVPLWRAMVSFKSWTRLTLKLLHFVAASLFGALYIRVIQSIATSSSSLMPSWLMLSFGAVHAVFYNVRGGDRVVYPAIHLSRLRRMLDAFVPALRDSSFVWSRAALLSAVLFFITPSPLVSFGATVSALVSSMMYTFGITACGKLVHILLSERLSRRSTTNDPGHDLV
jgi:hypothetical protein